jgi:hypothetical protein
MNRWLDMGSSESKAKGSFGQKEFDISQPFCGKNYNMLYLYLEAVILKIWKYTPHKRAILKLVDDLFLEKS